MDTEFTSREVSRLAGFQKPWMLNHLEREGIFVRQNVTDRRNGRARKYTFVDLLILRSINRMLEMGARPARIKDVVCRLVEIDGLPGAREAAEQLVRDQGVRLFVTKNESYLIRDDQQLLDLAKGGQLTFGFMLSFKEIAHDVADVVRDYAPKCRNNWKADEAVLDQMCRAAGI